MSLTYNGFIGGYIMIKLTDDEKETLSYSDVAYLILKDENKKNKIHDLFKKVIKALGQGDSEFEDNIGAFFESIITDKRFIMLDGGYCDLKINHSAKIVFEDDDDYEIVPDDDVLEEDANEDNYDDEANADDDADDDLQDLVILDDSEELDESDMM